MTTLYEEKVCCSLCHTETSYTGIGSTNTMGSPDLDTRPPEMKRSTMFAWVQRCPECGYCASDIGVAIQNAQEVVIGQEYKDQLNNPAYPGLASSFLCTAILLRKANNFAGATWALIHAAWTCDDSGHAAQAISCRQKAAEMLMLAKERSQQVSGQVDASTAILVDLLRRSGQSGQARQMIEARRGEVTENIIARILDYETVLLDKNDLSSHTVAEAL